MQDSRFRLRLEQLELMHQLMTLSNNEELYAEWIEWVPDEPSQSDLQSIVSDTPLWNEVCEVFQKLVSEGDFYS